MLEIKPVLDRDLQKQYCEKCDIPYDANMLAYSAFDGDTFLGVCQFTLNDRYGYIRNLSTAVGVDDFEAMFIMGRAIMNFIDQCDVHACVCADDACEERLYRSIGFKRNDEGLLYADMTHMFGGCGGHSAQDNQSN